MSFLTTLEGASLYYEHHLPDSPTRKPAVIFSCAYCTTRENWRGQLAPLLEAGHPVVLWDLRGHGESKAPLDPAPWSIDNVVADLHAVAEVTTPDAPFVAAGLSFGGLASLHFAHSHPGRVAGLILIGSGPGFKKAEAAEAWAAQVERTAAFLEQRGFADFVGGRAGTTCVGLHPETPAAQAAAAAIIAQDVASVARFGREVSGPAPSVIDVLGDVNVLALVLVGEHDKPFKRAAEVMAAKLPRARHILVPAAGHIVNLDEPEVFHREILAFLDEAFG